MVALPASRQHLAALSGGQGLHATHRKNLNHTFAVELGDDSKDAIDKIVYDVGRAVGIFWAVSLPFKIQSPAMVMKQKAICL